MDNFEKHIREAMNNPPEFAFKESMWDDMESRLDAGHHKKDKGWFWLPILFTLLLGSSITSGYLYSTKNNLQHQVVDLKRALENKSIEHKSYESSNRGNSNMESNGLKTKNIVLYDTIYKKVIIEKNVYVSNARQVQHNNHPLFSNASYINAINNRYDIFKTKTVINSQKNYANLLATVRNDNTKSNSEVQDAATIASLYQQILNYNPYLPINNVAVFPEQGLNLKSYPTFLKERKLAKAIKKLSPRSFSLSADIGRYYLLSMPRNTKKNLHTTLMSEFHYGQISLLAGIGYMTNNFAYEFDSEHPSDVFPQQIAKNEGDELFEVYGDFGYLQIPFGVKYSLLPYSNFHPYIGIGGYYQKLIDAELEYEFYTIGIRNEYEIPKNVKDNNFSISDIWTSIGVEYDWKRQWSIFGEINTQINLDQKGYKYENRQFIKWKGGVKYHF